MTLTAAERRALILDNISLAKKIAKSKKKKLSHISYEELESAAYLGLVEAANKYESSENDCFPAYAVWRVIGAVRDYLRELNWGSRSRPIKAVEILVCDENLFEKQIETTQVLFEEIIQDLPTVNKTVMALYYQDGMKIKEIADDFSVHQSRVSQILSDSRLRLRTTWQDRRDELWAAAA